MRLVLSLSLIAAGVVVAVEKDHATRSGAVLAPLAVSREPELRATRSLRRPPLPVVSHRSLRGAPFTGQGTQRRSLHGWQRWTHLNWPALARCESSGNPRDNTGNGYYGAYQFDLTTWRSVGGQGFPSDAPLSEQTYRAELLYAQRGRAPWPVCGRWLT